MVRVMIDVGPWLFPDNVYDLPTLGALDIPDRAWCTANQDAEHAHEVWVLGQMLLGNFVFPFSPFAVDYGNLMSLGMSSNTTTDTPRHAHQMGIVQTLVGTLQPSPPRTETTRRLSQPKVSIEYKPIHAIVSAIQKISIVFAKLIQHIQRSPRLSRQYGGSINTHAFLVNCHEGATSFGQSPGSRVGAYCADM